MKKLLYLLSFVLLPFISNASHLLGGEITWTCLPNGQYIFSMTVYRDCSGISWNFQNETIDILGNPLPTNGINGPAISSITIKPDRIRLANSNNGDLSPSCTPVVDSSFSCANYDNGSVQMFTYTSDPVNLTGTPPTTGWRFFWEGPCCRPNDLRNVNTTNLNGGMLLRAVMYPLPGGLPADPCFDSSPFFRALPATLICRGSDFTYNQTALDEDLDSLAYSWDRPYDPPLLNPQALSYKAGFSFTNPTPDRNQNSDNIPASLDPLTGLTQLAVFSGVGIEKYLTVVKVDAYRSGQKISTVFREVPIAIFDCPDLPGSSGVQNNPPEVKLNGISGNSLVVTATAGQTVKVPVEVIDNDRTNVAPFQQELTLTPDGLLFTRSKTGPSQGYAADPVGEPCIITSKDVHPCAYLRNSGPFVDPTATPPVSVIQGLGVINTEFVWQTSCNHVERRTGMPGTNEGVHNFVLRVQDDHCPIPGINYPTITVRVVDPLPLTAPVVKGVSVNLDGTTTYSWVAPIDSANQFNDATQSNDHYESTSSTPLDNQSPGPWASRNNNIQNYQQDKRDSDFSPYNFNNLADPSLGFNILESKDSHRGIFSDYYVRMKTLSGCTDTNASAWSEPARIMELSASDGSANGQARSTTQLQWNRAKSVSAFSPSYWKYESPTKYYIHVNDSFASGKLQDSISWYIAGTTLDTNYTIGGGACNDIIAYRVEARDTVVTYKAGASLRDNLFDTLVYSTFSTVDTFYLNESKPQVITNAYLTLQSDLNRDGYRWIDCSTNSVIPAADNKNFVPTKQGSYRVIAADDLNNLFCNDTSDCFTTIVLSDSVMLYTNDSLRANMSGMSYQWIDCSTNMPITGATSQNFKPQDTGYYKVVISAYGYSDTSRCVPVFAIAIEEESLSEGISYYPNPTNGLVNINLKSEAVNLTVVVRNIQGQLVQEQQFRNKANLEIEIEGKAGIYFIQLTNEKGDRANLKVVKQ